MKQPPHEAQVLFPELRNKYATIKSSQPIDLLKSLRAERLARSIEALAVRAATPKYGCLMAMVRGTLEDDLLAWGEANIPDSELDPTEGRETETHVTVLYGFNLDFDASRLGAMLKSYGEVPFTLGKVSRFECPNYDVIKVDVLSKDMERLNWQIAKTFEPDIKPSEHQYHAHITLAYVKKGGCRELDGNTAFEGRKVRAVELLYSLPEKKGRQTISLDCVDAADKTAGDTVQAASGAFAAGHKFWGNQWGGHAKDLANDPAGEPWGKIRHAVLVIGGKRFKGPSHFQALQEFEKAGGKYSNEGLNAEGFETESGHFFDREQAALYVEKEHLTKSGTKRFEQMSGKKWLAAQDLPLAAVDGSLYTQDAVQAAEEPKPVSHPDLLAEHDRIRKEAQSRYQRAVNQVVAAEEAAALAAMKRKGDAKRKKRREEEMEAAALLLFLAGVAIYKQTSVRLAALLAPGAAYSVPQVNLGVTPVPQPTNAPSATPGAFTAPSGEAGAAPAQPETGSKGGLPTPAGTEEAEEFALSRKPLLEPFVRETAERMEEETREGRRKGLSDGEIAERLAKVAEEVEAGRGGLVAETESQANYGSAQIRLLKTAGFSHKIWTTMEDERVRDSHVVCGNQGEVPMDKPFANGLMFPGDPKGGPEEVINCFPADTLVEYPGLRSAARRWHSGDMVEVSFAGGNNLAATPNHPVLRSDGVWVPIGQLKKGDNCVGCSLIRHSLGEPDIQSMPAKIGDVYSSAEEAGYAERIAVRPPDFHGDVTDSDVEIVSVERKLDFNREAASTKQVDQFGFSLANQAVTMLRHSKGLPMIGFRPKYRNEIGGAMGFVGSESIEPLLFRGSTGSKQSVGLCPPALLDASLGQAGYERQSVNTQVAGNGSHALPCNVAANNIRVVSGNNPMLGTGEPRFAHGPEFHPCVNQELSQDRLVLMQVRSEGAKTFATNITLYRVVNIKRFHFNGHVFNLDTGEGYYTANGIATQNCRCWLTGGRRIPGTGHLKASEPFNEGLHPRGQGGKFSIKRVGALPNHEWHVVDERGNTLINPGTRKGAERWIADLPYYKWAGRKEVAPSLIEIVLHDTRRQPGAFGYEVTHRTTSEKADAIEIHTSAKNASEPGSGNLKASNPMRPLTDEDRKDADEFLMASGQFEESEHPRGEHGKFATSAERELAVGRAKSLMAGMSKLAQKGGLTHPESVEFRRLSRAHNAIRFNIARPTFPREKVTPPEQRQSTLSIDTVLVARADLKRDRHIYDAIMDAAVGSGFNEDTAVDDIMEGRSRTVLPWQLYHNFDATRGALRSQYGDTVTLFRATGKQKPKATTNWATTREYAAQFGNDIESRQVPIDDVIAVNVGLSGDYHEIVVGKPPVKTP